MLCNLGCILAPINSCQLLLPLSDQIYSAEAASDDTCAGLLRNALNAMCILTRSAARLFAAPPENDHLKLQTSCLDYFQLPFSARLSMRMPLTGPALPLVERKISVLAGKLLKS